MKQKLDKNNSSDHIAQQWMLDIYVHHAWVGLEMDDWLGNISRV